MDLDIRQGDAKVLVDGATGYLGNHLVAALVQEGLAVRCLVRPGANAHDLQFLQSKTSDIVQADLKDKKALTDALSGCSQVIHLIGSIAPKRGESLSKLHVGQTEALVKAAKQAELRKIIMVTALGSAPDAASEYHRTKWKAEEVVRNSGIDYAIVRPSLIVGRIFGRRDSKLVSRYMHLIDSRRKVPLIAGGKNLIQPIFIADLTACLTLLVVRTDWRNRNPGADPKTFELGGPDMISMRKFVEMLMDVKGVHKPIGNVPLGLAKIAAMVCETFQSVPTISGDQIKISERDNICKYNALASVFGLSGTPLDEALETYITINAGSLQ